MLKPDGLDNDIDCVSAALAHWDPQLTQNAIDYIYFSEYFAINGVKNDSTVIDFDIEPQNDFIDMSGSLIQIKVQITKADGTAIGAQSATDSVGFVQLPPCSLFTGLNFILNEHSLSDSYGTFNQSCYLQTLMSFSKETKKTRLSLCGYYSDDDFSADTAHGAAAMSGYKHRCTDTALSKIKTYFIPIMHSFWLQPRFLCPMIGFRLEFTKAPPALCLKSNKENADYLYKIVSMNLWLKKVKIMPSIKLAWENRLSAKPAQYPQKRFFCKPKIINAGTTTVCFENLFDSKPIPDRCFLALIEQTVFRGTYSTDPYKYSHHSLAEISLSYDNHIFPSPHKFQMDYSSATKPDWTQPYLALHSYQIKQNYGMDISYENFPKAYCLYTFQFGADGEESDHIVPDKNASVRAELVFKTGTKNPALMLLIF